jgi:hypothetical protein
MISIVSSAFGHVLIKIVTNFDSLQLVQDKAENSYSEGKVQTESNSQNLSQLVDLLSLLFVDVCQVTFGDRVGA